MLVLHPHPHLKHVYLVGKTRAFVRAERGRWILTHRCVVVACPHPDCLAPPGRPCNGPGKLYTTTTHVQRRNAEGWKEHKPARPVVSDPDCPVCAAAAERRREQIIEGIQRARSEGKPIGRPKVKLDLGPAIELIEKGYSIAYAARALGLARSTLRRRLIAAGRWPR